MRCDLAVCVLGEVTNSHTVYLESSFLCFFFIYLYVRNMKSTMRKCEAYLQHVTFSRSRKQIWDSVAGKPFFFFFKLQPVEIDHRRYIYIYIIGIHSTEETQEGNIQKKINVIKYIYRLYRVNKSDICLNANRGDMLRLPAPRPEVKISHIRGWVSVG